MPTQCLSVSVHAHTFQTKRHEHSAECELNLDPAVKLYALLGALVETFTMRTKRHFRHRSTTDLQDYLNTAHYQDSYTLPLHTTYGLHLVKLLPLL